MSNHAMDPNKFKQDMGALAFGGALHAAASDYKQVRSGQKRFESTGASEILTCLSVCDR